MSSLRSALIVAKWEFTRYFKPKSELISLAIWIAIGAMMWGGQQLLSRFQDDEVTRLLMVDEVGITIDWPENIKAVPAKPNLEASLASARQDNADAVLHLASMSTATLYADDEDIAPEILVGLNQSALSMRLRAAQISEREFAQLSAAVNLEVRGLDDTAATSKLEKVLAVVVLSLVLAGVFTGFSYFFVSITSEKQQRVSEQIVSTISAQAWADGKILGLTCLSLKSMATMTIWGLLGFFIYQRFGGDSGLALLEGGVDPGLLLLLILFAALGLLLWSTFYAVVAASISDPNSSSRSAIMLIPIVPVVLAFSALGQTDTFVVTVLSWFPVTSFVFMPLRLVTEAVPVWDWALSIILLLGAILVLRIAAGRVLKVAMLMFGQEPKWGDIWQWARSGGN